MVYQRTSSSNIQTSQEIYKLKRIILIKVDCQNFPINHLNKIGINFALTVYGSVASELPIYNINVINTSKNNPHFSFNFSINPKSIHEYKKYC